MVVTSFLPRECRLAGIHLDNENWIHPLLYVTVVENAGDPQESELFAFKANVENLKPSLECGSIAKSVTFLAVPKSIVR